MDDWIKTSVPSTVLAAQAAAKLVPDPYFGMNLRNMPGGDYPIGHNFCESSHAAGQPVSLRLVVPRRIRGARRPHLRDGRLWLHFGGINYRGEVWINGKRIADTTTVAGAYRVYDFDVTDALKPGGRNVLAVETFAPTEKDLGINWVDWNPCPPDKDMGLWGEVDLVYDGSSHGALADGGDAFFRRVAGHRELDRVCRSAQCDGARN